MLRSSTLTEFHLFWFLCYLSLVLTSVSERDFIEGRRRGLCRFINLVARHPFFSEDELVKTFLTFSGSVCRFVNPSCCTISIILLMMTMKCILFQQLSFSTHPLLTLLSKQDVQTKLRDTYKKSGDEFMTNRISTQAKVCDICTIEESFLHTVSHK